VGESRRKKKEEEEEKKVRVVRSFVWFSSTLCVYKREEEGFYSSL
jgi:hypothetical protein